MMQEVQKMQKYHQIQTMKAKEEMLRVYPIQTILAIQLIQDIQV